MLARAFFNIAVESRRRYNADVVLLPCVHLQDEVIGVGVGMEVGTVVVDDLQRGLRWEILSSIARDATTPASRAMQSRRYRRPGCLFPVRWCSRRS